MTLKRAAYFARAALTLPLLIAGVVVELVETALGLSGRAGLWVATPFLNVVDGNDEAAGAGDSSGRLLVNVGGSYPPWRTATIEQPSTLGELDLRKPESFWILPADWTATLLKYERRDEGVRWYRLSSKSLGAFSWVLHLDRGLLFVKEVRGSDQEFTVLSQDESGETVVLCLDARDEGRSWYRVQNPARWRFA